jgi:uncharacterized membrane protein
VNANRIIVVYWALIYDHFFSRFEVWSNVSQHALNSVFALFELIFARTDPLPWIHIVWIVIMLTLYLGVAFITLATEHFYVYTFLDYHLHGRGRVAGYILGILALAIVAFVIVHFLILLRRFLTKSRDARMEDMGDHGVRGRDAVKVEA